MFGQKENGFQFRFLLASVADSGFLFIILLFINLLLSLNFRGGGLGGGGGGDPTRFIMGDVRMANDTNVFSKLLIQ